MIDPRQDEAAALYALDLLTGRERQELEARMKADPGLAARVREMADQAALLALAAPPAQPSPLLIEKIVASLPAPVAGQRRWWSRLNRLPVVYPLAACLVLTVTVFVLLATRSGGNGWFTSTPAPVARPVPMVDWQKRLAAMAEKNRALERTLQEKEIELRKENSRYAAALGQVETTAVERERLRREIQKMIDRAIQYHNAGPGLSRLVVIEMSDTALGETRPGFSERALEILTDASHKLSGAPAGSAGVIAPAQAPVAAITAVTNTSAATSSGVATNTGDEIAAITPEAAALNVFNNSIGALATVSGPAEVVGLTAAASNVREVDSSPDSSAAQFAPSGFSIWDETAQVGTLNVYDLPATAAGKQYQLWLQDAGSETPINVGLIPDLPNGNGQIYYKVSAEGVSPINVFITEEPAGGSTQPTGQTILRGPWPSDENNATSTPAP